MSSSPLDIFIQCPDKSSLCRLQFVSAPRSVAFFPCPDKLPPGCLQHVGFLGSDTLFPCPDRTILPLSLGRQCPLLFFFFRVLTSPFPYRLQFVSAPQSISFFIITCLSLCCLQVVSTPLLVAFFMCPEKSLPLSSAGSECPWISHFLSANSKVCPSAVSSWCVPLVRSITFHALTSLSLCRLQEVCAPHSVTSFCVLISPPLLSSGGECLTLGCFLSVF